MPTVTGFTAAEVSAALGGRFEIYAELRHGGQAVVYRAVRRARPDGATAEECVALKIHTNTSELVRADREVTALDGFEHPCLAEFVEYGNIVVAGHLTRYVAWRYINGVSLDLRLSEGPLCPHSVACVGRDVCRAINHIWQKRIVHRDINPKNVMLVRDGTAAVLIDLGVARFLDMSTITATGVTWGTLGYFSPEQWYGDNVSCHSDVFSLAVTLQEALSGHHPTRRDQEALIRAPLKTSAVCANAPARLAELIDRCLALRPAFRPGPAFLEGEFAEIAAQLS